MIHNLNLESLTEKLRSVLPDSSRHCPDLDQQFKKIIEGGLSKLNLVTREEFEQQCQQLEKARQKLQELEAKINSSKT